MEGFKSTLEDEAKILKSTLNARQRYCAHVRYGQLKLLHKLIDSCSGEAISSTASPDNNQSQASATTDNPPEGIPS